MNLLEMYIPEYSGHVESIGYDHRADKVEVAFLDSPEDFLSVLKLVFNEVTGYIVTKRSAVRREQCIISLSTF